MKVVINACYGGFSISAKAERRYLELEGKESYFFTDNNRYDNGVYDKYIPIDIDNKGDMELLHSHSCYTIPNPQEVLAGAPYDNKEGYMVDGELDEESFNKACDDYNIKTNGVYFTGRSIKRDDPLLVQLVEELGEDADGAHAHLKIIDIPDDVEWHIEEYDGYEHIAETHRTWG